MNVQNQHSDSEESWILLNEEEQQSRKEVEEIKEVPNTEESDICVITDPEDVPISSTECHSTDTETEAKDAQTPVATVEPQEVSQVKLKPIVWTSSVTSACFMIVGLLIALYFQKYDDDVVNENSQDVQNNRGYPIGKDQKFAAMYNCYGGDRMDRNPDELAYRSYMKSIKDEYKKKEPHKQKQYKQNYKKEARPKRDLRDEDDRKEREHFKIWNEEGVQKQKEMKLRKKLAKYNEKEQDDYLNKKHVYLKQKEDNIRKRELKYFAKKGKNSFKNSKSNSTSHDDWYTKVNKHREKKRKQERESEWVFDRAQGRNKKRDRAHWYFDYMDGREDSRHKRT